MDTKTKKKSLEGIETAETAKKWNFKSSNWLRYRKVQIQLT